MDTPQLVTTETKTLSILERITGTDQVRRDLDLPLFDQGLLDSLGLVELLVAVSDEFGIDIAPTEVERPQWSTPRKIIAYLQERIKT